MAPRVSAGPSGMFGRPGQPTLVGVPGQSCKHHGGRVFYFLDKQGSGRKRLISGSDGRLFCPAEVFHKEMCGRFRCLSRWGLRPASWLQAPGPSCSAQARPHRGQMGAVGRSGRVGAHTDPGKWGSPTLCGAQVAGDLRVHLRSCRPPRRLCGVPLIPLLNCGHRAVCYAPKLIPEVYTP